MHMVHEDSSDFRVAVPTRHLHRGHLYFIYRTCIYCMLPVSVAWLVSFFALRNIANAMLFLGQRVSFSPEPCFSGTPVGRPGVT